MLLLCQYMKGDSVTTTQVVRLKLMGLQCQTRIIASMQVITSKQVIVAIERNHLLTCGVMALDFMPFRFMAFD